MGRLAGGGRGLAGWGGRVRGGGAAAVRGGWTAVQQWAGRAAGRGGGGWPEGCRRLLAVREASACGWRPRLLASGGGGRLVAGPLVRLPSGGAAGGGGGVSVRWGGVFWRGGGAAGGGSWSWGGGSCGWRGRPVCEGGSGLGGRGCERLAEEEGALSAGERGGGRHWVAGNRTIGSALLRAGWTCRHLA